MVFLSSFYDIKKNVEESSSTTLGPTDTTSFSCEGRPSGYYADIETGCQVYHMCDGLGRQFSYACPNTTLFQQRMLICDHWYMVNCSQSETDYSANLLIGQRDKPFVDDNTVHKRTPRPDLFGIAPQYDGVRGRKYDQLNQERNLIGGDFIKSDSSDRKNVKYFVPSHWSTELSQQTITENPRKLQTTATKDNVKTTTRSPIRRVVTTSTPPVLETTTEFLIESPSKYFLPPFDTNRYQVIRNLPNNNILEQTALTLQSLKVNITTTTEQSVSEDDSSTESSVKINNINNISNESEDINLKAPSKDLEPPKLEENSSIQTSTIDPQIFNTIIPNKELLPPKLGDNSKNLNRTNSIYDEGKIRDLRKVLFIPDYNFPLDPLPRPGYDSFSSYQVKATGEVSNNDTNIPPPSVTPQTDCPERCDPKMFIAGTCQPCILVKR
ncbi:uncharacterized protein LOC123300104 isoform X2 [Chrysoperla carnea]|uniref:uncharacterized protein LOC123300104 isoform X2 n=1 Tax=Chrysoperla carnea TaxID=189513 RepID=UPI001D0693D2|nr:uncharacterized protein LOC123300104 isoform X2 [Chrysoperla carnea]